MLLVATLVNWEVPARAFGLDSGGYVCDWPDMLDEPQDPSLVVRFASCPRSDRPSEVQVWLQGERVSREIDVRMWTTGKVVGGSTDGSAETAQGPTLLAAATVDFSGRSRHDVDAVAEMLIPRDDGGYHEVTRADSVAVELSPECTVAYRGARPAGPWSCAR